MDSKKFKRLGAVILSALMVFGQSGPVYADDDTSNENNSAAASSIGDQSTSTASAVIKYSGGDGSISIDYDGNTANLTSDSTSDKSDEEKTFTVYGKSDETVTLSVSSTAGIEEFTCEDSDGANHVDYLENESNVNEKKGVAVTLNASQKNIHIVFKKASVAANSKPMMAESIYKTVNLSLHTVSAIPDVSNNNENYSLAGAMYTVTAADKDGNPIAGTSADITADENGNISQDISVPKSAEKIKVEAKTACAKGFKLPKSEDELTQVNDIKDGKASFTFKEDPEYIPFRITLKKIDEERKNGAAPASGAVFKIEHLSGDKVLRTWYVETKEKDGQYKLDLEKDYFASGYTSSDLYLSDKDVVMPLGNIRIEEVSPSAGYTTGGRYMAYTSGHDKVSLGENGIVNLTIAHDDASGTVKVTSGASEFGSDTQITKYEHNARGSVTISCFDSEEADGSHLPLEGASFDIIYASSVSGSSTVMADTDGNGIGGGAEFKPGDVVMSNVKTGVDGTWTPTKPDGTVNTTLLSAGTYIIKETEAPEGYLNNDGSKSPVTATFTISSKEDSDKPQEVKVYNKAIRGSFKFQNLDKEFGTDPQGDAFKLSASYKIVLESDNPVNVNGKLYHKDDTVLSFQTENDGRYTSEANVLPYGDYRIEEVSAPAEYMNAEGSSRFSIKKDGKTVDTSYSGVSSHKAVAEQNASVNEIYRSGFTFSNTDAVNGKRTSGDSTNLIGHYVLINRSRNKIAVDKNGDGSYSDDEIIDPGKEVFAFSTDKEGNYTSPDAFIPSGSYEIKEDTNGAPVHYAANDEKVRFTVSKDKGVAASDGSSNLTIANQENGSALKITKLLSSTVPVTNNKEDGAVFDVVLARYVYAVNGKTEADTITRDDVLKAYDSRESAAVADAKGDSASGFTDSEFDEVTTGADGTAVTKQLAYGRYFYAERSNRPDSEAEVMDKVFEFNSPADGSTIEATVVNDSKLYTVKITKLDKDTGAKVTADSSSYMIKCLSLKDYKLGNLSASEKQKLGIGEGNYVTFVNDGSRYNIFRTYTGDAGSKGMQTGVFYPAGGKDGTPTGTVNEPVKIPAGRYALVEVDDPYAFKKSSNVENSDTAEFTIGADSNHIEGSADGTYTISVTNYNEQVTGTLFLKKTVNGWKDAGSSVKENANGGYEKFDESDMSGYGFTLYAAEDITSPDDGKVIVKKGDPAVALTHDPSNPYEAVGEKFCNKNDGTLAIDNLPVGKYVLKETTHPSGVASSKDEYSVIVDEYSKNDDQSAVYCDSVLNSVDGKAEKVLEASGDVTKVSIMKTDVNGQTVAGAEMSVIDADTKLEADRWTSADKAHCIAGLKADHDYILVENNAPESYVRAADQEFHVNADGKVKQVSMLDKRVSCAITDTGSRMLDGAEIEVYKASSDGAVSGADLVDKWTSSDKVHYITGLDAGKAYLLVEKKASDGYVTAETVKFTARNDNKDQMVYVRNKKVVLSMANADGSAVKGAEFTITDKADGTAADIWKSDSSSAVNGLKEGHTYIVHESKVPKGHVKAADIEFTAEGVKDGKKNDQQISITDKQIAVSFKDADRNAAYGAKLAVENSSGAVVDDWVADGKPHDISGLEEGESYTLVERTAPDGCVKASSISIKAEGADKSGKKENQSVDMISKYVDIAKVNTSGSYLKGAVITVVDENGNAVDKWNTGAQLAAFTEKQIEAMNKGEKIKFSTQDGVQASAYAEKGRDGRYIIETVSETGIASFTEVDKDGYEAGHRVSGLEEGKKYTIQETSAPKNYVKAEDSAFTVSGTDKKGAKADQHLQVTDKQVKAEKVDADGEKLAGAQLTVYKVGSDGTADKADVVDQWISSAEKNHYISGLEAGGKYVIVETIVPEGYAKMADHQFTAADDKKDQTEKLVDKRLIVKKADAYGNDLIGAQLAVTDKETGTVVDSWKSNAKLHNTSGLSVGRTYTLTETAAPKGYAKQAPVDFTVEDDSKDQTVEMTDTAVKISKADKDGKTVAGAELEAVDENGSVVDSWTSGSHIVDLTEADQKKLKDGKSVAENADGGRKVTVYPAVDKDEKKAAAHLIARTEMADGSASYTEINESGDEACHMVSGLEAGHKYTVKEVKVPAGYYYADDVSVEASGSGDTTYDMADTQVQYVIRKMDDKNNPVVGVTLKLTDITNADSPKEVELPNKGVTVEKPFELNGVLEADHKYKLEETNIVNSYYAAQAMEFAVGHKASDDKPVTITMIDSTTSVTVLSVDSDMKPVKGVKMQLIEAEPVSGSDKAEAVDVEAYKAEHADEFKAFVDAYKADHADVSDDDAQKAVEDEIAAGKILSIDENGHLQTAVDAGTDAGSEDTDADYIAVKNEDGTDKVVHEFETTDNVDGTDISAYVEGGKSYILREVEAPFGYRKAAEHGFTVTGELNLAQVITFTNQRQVVYVGVKAVDAKSGKALKGAEFALLNKGSKVVLDTAGKPAVKSTDANGYALFAVTYRDGMENGGYFIRETKSPDGYKINKDAFEIKLGKDYSFSETDPLMITVKDESRKAIIGRNGSLKTSAGIGIGVGIAAGIAGVVLIILLIVKGKKKDEDSES